jgi:hypothetical protein
MQTSEEISSNEITDEQIELLVQDQLGQPFTTKINFEDKVLEIQFSKEEGIHVKIFKEESEIGAITDQDNIKIPEAFRDVLTKEFLESAVVELEEDNNIIYFSPGKQLAVEELTSSGQELQLLFSQSSPEVQGLIDKYGRKVVNEPFEFTQMQLSVNDLSNFFKIEEKVLNELGTQERLVIPGKAFQKSLVTYRQAFAPELASNFDVSLKFVDRFKTDTTEIFNLCIEENEKEELIEVISELLAEFLEIKKFFNKGRVDLGICSSGLESFSKGITSFSVSVTAYIQKLYDDTQKELIDITKIKENLEETKLTLSEKQSSIEAFAAIILKAQENLEEKRSVLLSKQKDINGVIERLKNNESAEDIAKQLKETKEEEIKYISSVCEKEIKRKKLSLVNINELDKKLAEIKSFDMSNYREMLEKSEQQKHLSSKYTYTTGSSSWFHSFSQTELMCLISSSFVSFNCLAISSALSLFFSLSITPFMSFCLDKSTLRFSSKFS